MVWLGMKVKIKIKNQKFKTKTEILSGSGFIYGKRIRVKHQRSRSYIPGQEELNSYLVQLYRHINETTQQINRQ